LSKPSEIDKDGMSVERGKSDPKLRDMKKTINVKSNTHTETQQSTAQKKAQGPAYDEIKLGIDWHADHYRVSRMIDGTPPQPAQKFYPKDFLSFAQEQLLLAKQVYSCYEAGPGGFVLHRQLAKLGVHNYVVHPVKLDVRHTGVATDKTDCHQLALNLDRFLHGNDKALCSVYVPTPEEEQRRALARQREQLRKERHRMGSIGRSLLLTQGWRENTTWWKDARWEQLGPTLPAWLREQLELWRELLQQVDGKLKGLTAKVAATAPKARPRGIGALGFALLLAEICRWTRFQKARSVGGFTGLCGGVSSSGPHHRDLSITKTGNRRFRRLLIELAWRVAFYQPNYGPTQKAAPILLGLRVHARRKKQVIVALARQLAVDLWRWQTGQITPEKLGWVMQPT
jgi:transposase